jgi:uncharacterized protein (TIGR00297 family)
VTSELLRKVVHVGVGGLAFVLAFLSWWQALALAVAALLHNLFVLPLYGGRRLFRGKARRRGQDPGIVLYPASVVTMVLLFPAHLEIVAAGWLFMAVGDGMAGVVGMTAGRHGPALPWNQAKSWAGLLAFVVFGVPAALAGVVATARVPVDGHLLGALFAVGAVMAVVESLELGVNDNLVVPIGSAALLYAALHVVEPATLAASSGLFLERLPWALGVNLVVGLAAHRAGSVDLSGLVHGVLLGSALWVLAGAGAFLMLLLFFVIGTAATKLGYATKKREGTAQEKGGRRGAPHAWANTGAGVLFALLLAGSGDAAFGVAVAAAFATATSDTLGSEIGQAFGRRTFLISTFRPVPRGTEGAVSLEGTLAGVAGSALVGLAAWGAGLVSPLGVAAVVVAAFVGTTLESYLGALLERAAMIDNEAQNFLNTLAGGLVAVLLVKVAAGLGWA